MVAVNSQMLPLGTPLPEFGLTDVVAERPLSSTTLLGQKGALVMFLSNHCPYVIHIRGELVKVAHEALDRGIAVVAINSNSEQTHPQDGPEAMRALALEEGWRFPFLFDASQDVAKAFRAACTPDFFLFGGDGHLAYRGQFDDSRPKKDTPVTGSDLRAAISAVVAGQPASSEQRASIGCNIKWAPGNAPPYFG